jgi:hypothetical protein
MTQPSWTVVQNITSASPTQSVFVAQLPTTISTTSTNVSSAFAGDGAGAKPADSGGPGLLGGPPPNYLALEFYRLRFPYAWSWP